jgi:hypothetical protein
MWAASGSTGTNPNGSNLAYLLDSDILIDLSRGNVSASEYVDSLGEWSVSIVTGKAFWRYRRIGDRSPRLQVVTATSQGRTPIRKHKAAR